MYYEGKGMVPREESRNTAHAGARAGTADGRGKEARGTEADGRRNGVADGRKRAAAGRDRGAAATTGQRTAETHGAGDEAERDEQTFDGDGEEGGTGRLPQGAAHLSEHLEAQDHRQTRGGKGRDHGINDEHQTRTARRHHGAAGTSGRRAAGGAADGGERRLGAEQARGERD